MCLNSLFKFSEFCLKFDVSIWQLIVFKLFEFFIFKNILPLIFVFWRINSVLINLIDKKS